MDSNEEVVGGRCCWSLMRSKVDAAGRCDRKRVLSKGVVVERKGIEGGWCPRRLMSKEYVVEGGCGRGCCRKGGCSREEVVKEKTCPYSYNIARHVIVSQTHHHYYQHESVVNTDMQLK
jgi:hypothetical protein